MNILFLTGHPAQVHNFKLLKNELERRGHNIYWIATNKDISKYLLDFYHIKYTIQKKPGKTFLSKVFVLISNSLKVFQFIRKNKIDIIVSRVSPYAALAGIFTNTYHLALADTESSGIYDSIFTKLVSTFLTAKSFQRTLRKDQIRFDANIELFYLHPNRFQPIAKEKVAKLLDIQPDEPYVIMRFVSWDAYHDKGLQGFTDENKIKAVQAFSNYAKVFITAEKELPIALEPYKIQIPPEKMHDVLAHANLFFGESGTMASESAVLGTPAIYLDKVGRGYTDEEGKYELVFNFNNSVESQEKAIKKAMELLQNKDLAESMRQNRYNFLENRIDVTNFMVWFIENYPNSAETMKENPDYQYNFK